MSKRSIDQELDQNEKKQKAPKVKAPKTGIDMVVLIVRELQKAGGSSRQAIFSEAENKIETFCELQYERLTKAKALNKMLADGVKKGVLVKNKASYLVAGDPVIEEVQGPSITIEEKKEGTGVSDYLTKEGFL